MIKTLFILGLLWLLFRRLLAFVLFPFALIGFVWAFFLTLAVAWWFVEDPILTAGELASYPLDLVITRIGGFR